MASSIFFFYTLGILIVFIVTAVLSIAAWASSGRKLFIYASGAFICYTVEIIEIFFNEHISQNLTFTVYEYYSVSMPILRTLIATLSQAFIWATVLRALDKHSQKLLVIPPTVFLAARPSSLPSCRRGVLCSLRTTPRARFSCSSSWATSCITT